MQLVYMLHRTCGNWHVARRTKQENLFPGVACRSMSVHWWNQVIVVQYEMILIPESSNVDMPPLRWSSLPFNGL
jgi:hypothetical protein